MIKRKDPNFAIETCDPGSHGRRLIDIADPKSDACLGEIGAVD
jgi:hypothetical protein